MNNTTGAYANSNNFASSLASEFLFFIFFDQTFTTFSFLSLSSLSGGRGGP